MTKLKRYRRSTVIQAATQATASYAFGERSGGYTIGTTVVWRLYQCGGGARWSASNLPPAEDSAGRVCNFSGCNCGTKVQYIKSTSDRGEAGAWFRRPKCKNLNSKPSS